MGNQEPKTGEKKCLNDSFELDQQKTETADKNTQTVTKELQVCIEFWIMSGWMAWLRIEHKHELIFNSENKTTKKI